MAVCRDATGGRQDYALHPPRPVFCLACRIRGVGLRYDPPIKSKLISPLRLALANADAKAQRGRLILVMLESIEAIPATASRKRIAASASGRRSRSARCGRGCEPGGSNAAAGAIFRRPLLSTFESPQQAGGKAGRSQALQTSLPRSSLLWRLPQQAKPSFPSIRRFESACTRFPR